MYLIDHRRWIQAQSLESYKSVAFCCTFACFSKICNSYYYLNTYLLYTKSTIRESKIETRG
jgi:hypothetical protein